MPNLAALAVVVVAYLAFFSYIAGMQSGLYRGARTAAAVGELEPVRDEVVRQFTAAREDRSRARRGVRALTDEMIEMQTRLVYLDALAMRLARTTPIEDLGIDFGIEPPRGGPEELPLGSVPHDSALRGGTRVLASQVADRWQQLTVLEDLLVRRKLSSDVVPEGLPVVSSAYVSSPYGNRLDPLTGRLALHKGVDFAGRPGTEIVAVAAGIVIWSGLRSGYGETVEIDHGNDRITRYAHNAENIVAVGDVVARGQPIARLGSTGRTTGPNLHFEVLTAGKAVDPAKYMRE